MQNSLDLSNKTCMFWDRGGLYQYMAVVMGRKFGKVFYYIPDAESYPESPKAQIGQNIPEIQRITDDEYFQLVDRVDLHVFADCYDGARQQYLRSQGHRVFGSGLSEKMEIDNIFFLEMLTKLGLPVPYAEVPEGVDELVNFLKDKNETWWIKNQWRGDFETKKFTTMNQLHNWLSQYLIPRLGQRSLDIPFIVQENIESACEGGFSGFRVNGICLPEGILDFEAKDKALIGKHVSIPPIIKQVNDGLTPFYQQVGYWGAYANEMRITDDGTVYVIDETARMPSPPGEGMVLLYDSFPEDVWLIAGGEEPILQHQDEYIAELILTSDFYDKHEIAVEFPEEVAPNIMLKNYTKRGDIIYCIPNNNGAFFGGIAATGKTLDEAIEKCIEVSEQIICDSMDCHPDAFEKAKENMEAGRAYGLGF